MKIIFVENREFAKRLAKITNSPYADMEQFRIAVSQAHLAPEVAAKLAKALLTQISAENVVFGLDVENDSNDALVVRAAAESCSYVTLSGQVHDAFMGPEIFRIDIAENIGSALGLYRQE